MPVVLHILITFQALFGVTIANQLCTADKVQECYEMLIKDGLSSATVLYFSEEQMTEHCRRHKIFSQCLKTIEPYCTGSSNTSYLAYKGLDDAYEFACGDGFSEYVQYQATCFKEEDVQFEATTCEDMFTARSNYLKANITDRKYARARYCQYIDDYIDCVYNLLLSFCGTLAAKWQETFISKSVQPTMVALGCPDWPINEKDTSTDNSVAVWVISLGAAIVATGLMVVVGLCLLVCSRCRCRRRCRCFRRSSTGGGVVDTPPPPYSAPPFVVSRLEQGSTTTTTTELRTREEDGEEEGGRRKKTSSSSSSVVAVADERRRRNRRGDLASVFRRDGHETEGAVGGGAAAKSPGTGAATPFARSYTPSGHFELPSTGSSILSHIQSSDDDDTASLISHTCDYY